MDSLVIVDCQYDFIDGSLACSGSHEAVAYLINFINRHEMEVLYTSDWHSPANRSFKVNGGIWPIHCVAGEKGSALDRHFFADIIDVKNRPNEENIFHKGMDDIVEVEFEEDGEVEKYKLVTSIRGNSMENRISIESPIGKALRGHRVGDRVEVKVNDDYSYYLVIKSIDKTGSEDEEIRGF